VRTDGLISRAALDVSSETHGGLPQPYGRDAHASREEQVAFYRSAVTTAYQEVEDALAAQRERGARESTGWRLA
jgi:hypothetical protein